MADSKPAEQAKNDPPKSTHQPQSAPASSLRQGNSGQDSEPGEGLKDALQAAHEARTKVPGFDGVDARLDNRAGAARPPLEEWPAKPQQIDGPDVAHQNEHTRKVLSGRNTEDLGPRKGMHSIGSHGLGDDEQLREGRPVQSPNEG